MTEALLKLFGCSVPRNQVEVEKHQLSKWADTMMNVDAEAKKLLLEASAQSSSSDSAHQGTKSAEAILTHR